MSMVAPSVNPGPATGAAPSADAPDAPKAIFAVTPAAASVHREEDHAYSSTADKGNGG